ncbi:MAG: hypothetical protein WB780_00450 [Candidatus Acidiferrales bacterium]
MTHKGIATLASAVMLCFLLLSHFDQQFFLVHFYESLIFLAIVLMLFYSIERWAYMLGMIVPAAWLLLTFAMGAGPGFLRQVQSAVRLQRADSPADLLGAIVAVLSVALVIVCAVRWRREFAGLGKGWSTFWICMGVTTAYYGVLVVWLLRWTPVGRLGV